MDQGQNSPTLTCLLPPPAAPPGAPPAAAEKSVVEYKDKLPQAVVDSINAAIADVRGVMDSENPEVCA